MKKLVTLLLLSSSMMAINSFAAQTTAPAAAPASTGGNTVYVAGKPVPQSVVNQAIDQFKKSSPMAAGQLNNPQFKQEILQSIGMQYVFRLKGDEEGLDKSPEYQQKLDQIKPMIYAQIFQEKCAGTPTDAQIQAKYNDMKKQMAAQQQYDVSHILVKDLATANKIETELKGGANFAAEAKKYSIDPGSKDKGGELGWSDGSNYVPEFTAAIKTLKKGQYTTTPVKSQFGYHIILLNDVKTGSANSLPPFDKIKSQLVQQIQMEKTKQCFDNLKTQYKVEVK